MTELITDERIGELVAQYEEHRAARDQAEELGDEAARVSHHQAATRAIGEAYRLTKLSRLKARDL